MAKDENKPGDSNQCPKCQFAGKDTSNDKFSNEQITQFPKGYATENHPKITLVTRAGQQLQEFAKDKNKQIIFNKIKRCPICGHTEGDNL